ncbi:hypothetical protein CMT75_18825 [Elizabethkingia anophelis]|nr:hypothetical protein [Elizabethkingia anophelis]
MNDKFKPKSKQFEKFNEVFGESSVDENDRELNDVLNKQTEIDSNNEIKSNENISIDRKSQPISSKSNDPILEDNKQSKKEAQANLEKELPKDLKKILATEIEIDSDIKTIRTSSELVARLNIVSAKLKTKIGNLSTKILLDFLNKYEDKI